MFRQLTNLASNMISITASIVAFGWLVQYAFSDEIAEAEENDEVKVDDDND